MARPGTPTLDELAEMELNNGPSLRSKKNEQSEEEDERKLRAVQAELAGEGRRSETPELNELLYEEEMASEHGKPLPPIPPMRSKGQFFSAAFDDEEEEDEGKAAVDEGQGSKNAADDMNLSTRLLLRALYQHYLTQAQEFMAKSRGAYNPDKGLEDEAVLVALGEGLSPSIDLGKVRASKAADIVSMMLLPSDLPSMRPGPLTFKLGSSLPPIPPSSTSVNFPDVHAPFCNQVFQLRTEFSDFDGSSGGPSYVVDMRYIFETPKDARKYFKKSWRFLSENGLPTKTTARGSCREHFEARTNTELEGIPLGDACRVFRNEGADGVMVSGRQGVAGKESLVFVVLVDNAVIKIAACSKLPNIPLDTAFDIASKAVARQREWCHAVNVQEELKALPSPHQLYRTQLLASWKKQCQTYMTSELLPVLEIVWKAPEACRVCNTHLLNFKRCSGCRAAIYCSEKCQAEDWGKHGHKESCSQEFLLK